MAQHKSAEKRIRQTKRRTEVNRARTSRMRSAVKEAETAVAGGDKAAAQKALRATEPELMRAVKAGLVKKNTASRKISRLTKRIKAL
ncbi:MAG TPA: 30S ribosomal protein S20 [Magnetospirillaceae bacterium]|jgi:small subunit ribosomal protein S20